MLFDTHTHVNVSQFKTDADAAIQRAAESGVSQLSVVGFDYPTIQKALELSSHYEHVYPTIGWHPTEAGSYTDEVEAFLLETVKQPEVIAVGEMGLDYHWMSDSKSIQQDVFRRQIRLAKEINKPLTIHNREATEDTYRVIKEEGLPVAGGIMHSFGVDTYWMEAFLDLGLHISLSGVVTFKNAQSVKAIAKAMPIERLLIETDAPYLSPEPNRGKRNEPAYVKYVAKEIARLKDVPFDYIAKETTKNANQLFKLEGLYESH